MRSLFGYSDKISVRPGERISFFVSSLKGLSYTADIVRLVCGDDSPSGPGFKETPVPTDIDGEYPGRAQPMHDGSYVIVPPTQALSALTSFTLQTMVWPTTPGCGRQALLGTWCEQTAAGVGLFIDEAGALEVRVGAGSGAFESLSTGTPLVGRQWYAAAASFDAASGELRLMARPLDVGPGVGETVSSSKTVSIEPAHPEPVPLLIAARAQSPGATLVGAHFNGKLDRPRVARRALSATEIGELESPTIPDGLIDVVVACWDFSRELSGVKVIDLSAGKLHGTTVNMPARGVRGHNWTGSEHCWRHAPQEYGAIHFHDDDLYDAGWQTDFTLTIPQAMRSGVYCARLIGGEDEDRIPFFVRPPAGKKTSDVVLLISTATYMAYANIQFAMNSIFAEPKGGAITVLGPDDVFLQENPEYGLSLYDKHTDETGVCYTSRLRPIFNMRPKSGLWSFNADTHVTDWLEAIGQDYDVVTDEDLHHEGLSALVPYRVVVTGAHPEYWSTDMWEAMVGYQGQGGRLMYLGGNGFYWRIAYHDTLPGVLELRRAEGGMRYQSTEPGEYYQSFNGELGGLWRRVGAPPNTLVGVGTVATGFDSASYYRRMPDSHDPRAAFIFDGIGEDELIGDFGALSGGAAGIELDAASRKLGTPPHVLVVARSECHSQLYYLCPEETPFHHPVMNGAENDRVRADMVFYETPAGGGVFSTGSISWCASLAHLGYDNNVARLTGNVLRRFLEPEEL